MTRRRFGAIFEADYNSLQERIEIIEDTEWLRVIIVDTREFVTVIVEICLNQKLERDIKGNVEHFQRKRVLVISWDLIENLLLSLFLYVFECLV